MNYKNRLTLSESISMINDVYGTVFAEDEETGRLSYLPELYDYAFRLAVAHYYGGYEITGEAAEDYSAAMDIDLESPEIGCIVDMKQLNGIRDAVNEKIEMKKSEIQNRNVEVVSKFDELIPVVRAVGNALADKIKEIDTEKITKQINSLDINKII